MVISVTMMAVPRPPGQPGARCWRWRCRGRLAVLKRVDAQVFTGMFSNDWPAACAAHSIATIKIEQLASMRDSANSDTVTRSNR